MADSSFFFYDLETSGSSARTGRVLQFAGQRASMDLEPIGEPIDQLIKLTPDVLPDPDAVLVNGITPQASIADGITEAEFLRRFEKEITAPNTIFVGFNSVRFDDEFMRFLHYRNFYDAYEWQWCEGCSRWDILDVVRMTRALRPDGIQWGYGTDGRPSNRLTTLTAVNGLDHENAHDALNDVQATLAVAKLIATKQPKLFRFLCDMRDKKQVARLVTTGEPFVYTSGSYSADYLHTTVVVQIADAPNGAGAIVYDLRVDPTPLTQVSATELSKKLGWQPRGAEGERLPIKVLRFNRCPAIAPLQVLDTASQERIAIDLKVVESNRRKLADMPQLAERVKEAFAKIERERGQVSLVGNEHTVDAQLYDGFFDDADKSLLRAIRGAAPDELAGMAAHAHDPRIGALLPLYKARNYPQELTSDERQAWEAFCAHRLLDGGDASRLAKYFNRIQELASRTGLSAQDKYLLEELRLYGESIMPSELPA